MRCLECKIVKYDKATKKWTCPAHPWAEINLYTEHRNCGASRWYPEYVNDRLEAARIKSQDYETFSRVVGRAVEDAKACHLPGSMLQELDALQSRVDLHAKTAADEFELLADELERLTQNGLH